LHKGERVLTKVENDAYSRGKGGVTIGNITLNYTGTGSTEKDAEKLFEIFVRKVEAAGGAGA